MMRNGFNCYFLFWAIFLPFTFLTAQNIKIKKKKTKKPRKYHHFTIVYQNHDHILYGSWDMVHGRCNYFSFWSIFCPFTPLTAPKIKILKKWKKHQEISSFHKCVPKIMIRWCTVPEICCAMDGWKKWHIEVAAPPKNKPHQLNWINQIHICLELLDKWIS